MPKPPSKSEQQKAEALRAEARAKATYLDERIPQLHELGKPEAEVDEKGKVKPGRSGRLPGRLARDRAEAEWAQQRGEMNGQG